MGRDYLSVLLGLLLCRYLNGGDQPQLNPYGGVNLRNPITV